MKQKIKPKYNIGDLVCNGEGIVVKIHEKADYNEAFYLVHFIQTELEQWIRERSIDFTLQQQYTMYVGEISDIMRKRDEVQNHYDEQVLSES